MSSNRSSLPAKIHPGGAIEEKVTSELLNAMLDAIKRAQPPEQVTGGRLTLTDGGWMLDVRPAHHTGRPKLWHVDLGDVTLDPFSIAGKALENTLSQWTAVMPSESDFYALTSLSDFDRESSAPASIASAVETMIDGLLSILSNVETAVNALLNDLNPIQTTLKNYFEGHNARPSNGDYIYTEQAGIVYTIFKQHVSKESGETIPTENQIFRVSFTLGEGESAVTYVALTLTPAPDVFALLSSVITWMVEMVKKLLACGLSAVLRGVAEGILSGLNALFTELKDLIDLLQAEVDALTALVNGLVTDVANLWNALNALSTSLDSLSGDLQSLQSQVDAMQIAQNALQTALDALQATIDGAVNVSVIGADGNYHTVKVIEDTTGATAEREITWIDSDTGYGKKSKFLIKQGEPVPAANVEDVSWKKVDYIHPSGVTYAMHCLVRVANNKSSYPGYQGTEPLNTTDWPDYTVDEVIISDCEAGTSETKYALLSDTDPGPPPS